MKVNKVCIVGAGVMGSQLAQLMAINGYEVSMTDIEDKFGFTNLAENLDDSVLYLSSNWSAGGIEDEPI